METKLDRIKALVKSIYTDGMNDFPEMDRLYDPSDRKYGIDDSFKDFWENSKVVILQQIENL